LQLELEARKLFDIAMMDLGVSVLEHVIVQSLEDFISHWRLELWEIVFSCEFKHKGAILKNKIWNQQIGGEKAFKRVVYRQYT
jgi:hypothetical protein